MITRFQTLLSSATCAPLSWARNWARINTPATPTPTAHATAHATACGPACAAAYATAHHAASDSAARSDGDVRSPAPSHRQQGLTLFTFPLFSARFKHICGVFLIDFSGLGANFAQSLAERSEAKRS